MLSAKALLPVGLGEDTVPGSVHPHRWFQTHLAIASSYSLLDKLHVQCERSLRVPSRGVGASNTSSSPICKNNSPFFSPVSPFYQRFSPFVWLFYCSAFPSLISPAVSLRVKVGEIRLSPGFVEGKNNRTTALMPQGYGYANRRHLRLRIPLEAAS
jgi:hypothetical protein